MTRWTSARLAEVWFGPAFDRPPDPSVVPAGASPAERAARRALRWYSPSWREVHGEELVSTVLDTLPDRGDARLGARAGFDLARAGLRQRWHSQPGPFTGSRLARGVEPLTPEGLAWLRDQLDHRGSFVRGLFVSGATFLGPLLPWLVYTTVQPGGDKLGGLVAAVVAFAFWVALTLATARSIRRWSIARAGLGRDGWPLMWRPPPPVRVGPVPARPTRWVIGELRFAFGLAVVSAVVALGSVHVAWAAIRDAGREVGVVTPPPVFGLPVAALEVVGIAAAFGVVIAASLWIRARRRCRPDSWRNSLIELPRTAPDQVRHTLPLTLWPLAVLVLAGSAVPLFGWVVGMADVAAIPVILMPLFVVRRSESRTGVAVHQLQIRSVFML